MGEDIRVVHVEDDPDLAALTAEMLERENGAIGVATAETIASGLERVRTTAVDCVVSDYELPDGDGIGFLEGVRAYDDRLPFILFTGKGSEEVASDALAAGATDYLQKETGPDQYAVLANRIENAVSRARAVAARERQNDLHASAEAIADLGAWEYDVETGETWLSDGASRTLGLPPDDDPDLAAILARHHPEDREIVRAAIDEAVSAGEPFDVEARHVGADEGRWLRIRGDPKPADGEVRRLRATIQDVTERVERERDLERYETVVEAAGDAVYTLDAAGQFTFVNDALLSVTGYEEADLLGSHVSRTMTDESVGRGQAAIRDLRADPDRRRATFEMESVTADGERIPTEVQVALLPAEEGFRGTVGVVRDLRERKRRERALRRFRAMIEAVPVGIFLLDEEGVLIESNEAATEIIGLDRDAWIGEPFADLVDAGIFPESILESYVSWVRDLLSADSDTEMATIETEVTPPDTDDRRICRAHFSLLPHESEFAGTVGAYRDITTEREHERALARKSRRLENVTDVVGHGLRNPLSAARGRLTLARDAVQADHPAADHLAALDGALDRTVRMVDETLTLSREGEPVDSPAVVDLGTLATRAWPDDAGDATLFVEDALAVLGDADRLETVLAHCFENAIAHAGQDVTVRLGPTADGFYVADDGPGIPAADREAVFEPGFSTAEASTGLGLAIVEALLAAHGWTVTLGESRAGGARIEVGDVDVPK